MSEDQAAKEAAEIVWSWRNLTAEDGFWEREGRERYLSFLDTQNQVKDIASALRKRDEQIATLTLERDYRPRMDEYERVQEQLATSQGEAEAMRERLRVADDLITEVMRAHADPESWDYNECEKEMCAWCEKWRDEKQDNL
jgi:hypothetical protein